MTADTRTGAGPDVRGGAPDPHRDAGPGAGTIHARRRTIPRPRIVPLFLLAAFLCVLLLEGYVHGDFLADHRVHPATEAYNRVPEAVLDGGPVVDPTGRQATKSPTPAERHRADLRRRARPRVDPQGSRRTRQARRARHVLRRRSDGGQAPRRHGRPGAVGTGDRRAHVLPPRPRVPVRVTCRPRAGTDPAGARRRRRPQQLTRPAAVLLVRQRTGQPLLAGGRAARDEGVRRRVQRRRQPGLATAGRRRDRQTLDAQRPDSTAPWS